MTKCSAESCPREATVRGFCKRHYYAARNSGTLARLPVEPRLSVCKVEDCDRKVLKLNLCSRHYKRLRRNGTTEGRPIAEKGEPLQWLRDRVTVLQQECLEWPFSKAKAGYGRVYYQGKMHVASRCMAMLVHGDIPADIQVRHTCDNPPCCNPNHLVLGTPLQNHVDSVERGRHVPPPLKVGVENSSAKLTEENVREIRALWASGLKRFPIAKRFNVSFKTIVRIVDGEGWRHVA